MKQSAFLSINYRDFLKGFITAFFTAFLTTVIQILKDSKFPSIQELSAAGIIGLTAGIAYILKNWLTNSNDELLTKENK